MIHSYIQQVFMKATTKTDKTQKWSPFPWGSYGLIVDKKNKTENSSFNYLKITLRAFYVCHMWEIKRQKFPAFIELI